MMPQPTPVPILTNSRSSTVRASPACISPSAMMFTSLSTSTGQPRCWESTDRTGYWFQPGMIGGATGTPSRKDTGPGTPTPAPCRSTARPSARSLPTRSSTTARTASGPSRTSIGSATCPRTVSLPSVTATSTEVAPMSMARKRRRAERPTMADRRPPAGGRQTLRLHQADLGQPVELDGELRPGQVDGLAELGAADRALVTQQPEQGALVRVLRSDRHPPHATSSLEPLGPVTRTTGTGRDGSRVTSAMRKRFRRKT